MTSKSIVTWNIRHGGGNGERSSAILAQLAEFDADILVITEFRNNSNGERIKEHLGRLGYHVSHPDIPHRVNSILIASREPVLSAYPLDAALPDQRHLWVVDVGWLKLCGVYMPLNVGKFPYWKAIIDRVDVSDGPDLYVGDFNTGNNTIDLAPGATKYTAADFFDRFGASSFRDVWRCRNPEVREYTWFSPNAGNGFRLDHAFASGTLFTRVIGCEYLHGPRESRISDHSAMQLEIDVSPTVRAIAPAVVSSVIYALRDPIRPRLLKIGRDNKWPQRLRQAQSQTPRELQVAGLWSVDRDQAASSERTIQKAFPRADTDGREWLICGADAVVRISEMVGRGTVPSAVDRLKPYDDWRDYSIPRKSDRQRRLWIARESETGHLKIVHSPHIDHFHRICPTYSCLGFRWVSAWQFPAAQWQPSISLHPTDARIIEIWRRIVDRDSFGADSPRVGWLREGITLETLEAELRADGLEWFTRDQEDLRTSFVAFAPLRMVETTS